MLSTPNTDFVEIWNALPFLCVGGLRRPTIPLNSMKNQFCHSFSVLVAYFQSCHTLKSRGYGHSLHNIPAKACLHSWHPGSNFNKKIAAFWIFCYWYFFPHYYFILALLFSIITICGTVIYKRALVQKDLNNFQLLPTPFSLKAYGSYNNMVGSKN